jgi:hypothetical protein
MMVTAHAAVEDDLAFGETGVVVGSAGEEAAVFLFIVVLLR